MLRTSLQRRVSVMAGAFLAVVLVLTVLVLSAFVSDWEDRQDRPRPADSRWLSVTRDLDGVRDTLVRLNTRHTAYLTLGDPQALADRDALTADLAQRLPRFQADAASTGDTAVRTAATEIVDGARRWRTLADEQAALRAAGQQGSPRYAEITAGAPAGVQFLRTYGVVEQLSRTLTERRNAELERVGDQRSTSQYVLLVVAGTALLLVPTVLHLVRRWVLRPLDTLSGQFLGVAEGDLQTPVGLRGPPELAAVAAAAETMRRRILDELAEAVSAREALRQGQPLVEEVRGLLAAHPLPVLPGWSSAAALRPAEGLLAGDWYDVLPLADGRHAVVVADVSGHGARAGIVAIQLKRLLEAALHLTPDPDLALALAARVFSDEAERFASCVVAVVDPDSGTVTWANAGHPAPLVLRRDDPGGGTRIVEELGPTGPLLSWLSLDVPGSWSTRTTSLAPGSSLVVYTDGLVEARPGGSTDELGIDGVVRALDEVADLTPDALVGQALDVARRVSGGRARDDVTIVVLERSAVAVERGAAGRDEVRPHG